MTNELQVNQGLEVSQGVVGQLTDKNAMYSSIVSDGSRKSNARLYNLVQSPTHALADVVNTVINVIHVIAHEVELTDTQTGELTKQVRVVLVDDKNESYATVSKGVMQSLKQIFAIVGQPPYFDEPLELVVGQRKGNNGFKFLTLEMVVGE